MQILFSERILVLLALLLAALGLFATTFGTEYRLLGAVQSPVFFPRIILGIMIALTGVAIVQDLIARDGVARIEKLGALAVLVVAALLFANGLTRVGFFLSAVPFSVVSLWIFGLRAPVVLVVYALVVPGTLVVLFNHVLHLPLPTSPFTYFF